MGKLLTRGFQVILAMRDFHDQSLAWVIVVTCMKKPAAVASQHDVAYQFVTFLSRLIHATGEAL